MVNRHQAQPVRTGVVASFPNVDTMMKGFSKAVSLLSFDSQEFLERHGANTEAPNVVNIALLIFNEEGDVPEMTGTNRNYMIPSSNAEVSVEFISFSVALAYFTLRDFDGVWEKNKPSETLGQHSPSSWSLADSRTIFFETLFW